MRRGREGYGGAMVSQHTISQCMSSTERQQGASSHVGQMCLPRLPLFALTGGQFGSALRYNGHNKLKHRTHSSSSFRMTRNESRDNTRPPESSKQQGSLGKRFSGPSTPDISVFYRNNQMKFMNISPGTVQWCGFMSGGGGGGEGGREPQEPTFRG